MAAVVLACGAAYAWQRHMHPTVFPVAGNHWSGPQPDGADLMSVGVTFSGDGVGETVVIESVRPRIRKDTADATYEFWVCTRPDATPDAAQLGIVAGQRAFDEHCPAAEPVRAGTRLHTGADPAQQLVMVVRPRRAGVASTTGVELTYSHGWRRGTQLIGTEVQITRARAGSP